MFAIMQAAGLLACFEAVVNQDCLILLSPHSTDSYIEVLDGSRVHPETYEWARKMAVDALEYDESAEDANPAGALEEILENPERLKDLDLDAFAEELERQVCGAKFSFMNILKKIPLQFRVLI